MGAAPGPPQTPTIRTNFYIKWYHNDHLGTPHVMTDKNQNIRWQAYYYPFGKLAQETVSQPQNNLRFPGQYHDRATDLYYNQFRHYDPGLGRYITPDPIGLAGVLNLYSYAGQNPINYTDPLGLEKKSFGERWWCYFTTTNEAIPGLVLPLGSGFVPGVGSVFSRELSKPTFWQYVGGGWRGAQMGLGTFTAVETAIIMGGSAVVQAVYLGAGFEVGVGIGSAINAGIDVIFDLDGCGTKPRCE